MNKKKETTVLLLSLLITIGAVAGGLWWLNKDKQGFNFLGKNSPENSPLSTSDDPKTESESNSGEISTGREMLISHQTTPEKQAGIQAIATNNYSEAVSLLEQSLARRRNDPESLIYLNNARIGEKKSYTIAVPVPIGTEMTTAQEILRGVAQAQDEINQLGGINGVPLKVAIANDNNDPEIAKEVAQNLINNKDILGVVGHFSSGVTLNTAPIYQQKKLVAISATSTSVAISGVGNYIFRTVPSDRFTSNALAKYLLEKLNQPKATIIYNSKSPYSKSLRDTFSTDMASNGGEIVTEADLSGANFNTAETLEEAKLRESEVLVFLNDSQTVDRAFLLMQLNNHSLPMVAGNSIYKPQTLQIVGEKAVGLVLGVPWHSLGNTNSDFPSASRRLWGGDVNWRTAMAYDATKALGAGLQNNPTRQGIQQTLSQSGFSVAGASGTIKFLSSGDRNQAVQLVKVQPGNRSPYGYDFVPFD